MNVKALPIFANTLSAITDDLSGYCLRLVASFFVAGKPCPGGSKRAIPLFSRGKLIIKNGRPIINVVDAGKGNAVWKTLVATIARREYRGEPATGPIVCVMNFVVKRPKSHLRADGSVRPKAITDPTVKPDVLKLARSTEDALTGIVWRDDSQTVELILRKRYGEEQGVEVCVWEKSGGQP